MTSPALTDFGTTTSTVICFALLLAAGFSAARYWNDRSSGLYLIVRLLLFSCLTALILARSLVPYKPVPALGPASDHFLNGCLEIVWWIMAAGITIRLMRVFVVLGHKPRESKLMQDVLAALVYIAMAIAIVANVFDLPVKGLLATSGALAIILGLALQSSLADVFSGIVLDLERPYHVGDWVIVDDAVRGTVMETNWRSTHILTVSKDVAVLPNSVIAKAKLINCSAPSRAHGATLRVRLDASHGPAAGCNLLMEVLLGSSHVLRSPEPTVTIQELDADSAEYELLFSISDVSLLGSARNAILDRVFQAATAVGIDLVPRLGAVPGAQAGAVSTKTAPDRLLAGVSLFATLSDEEKAGLARQMHRKDYKPGDVVVAPGAVLTSLSIVSDGVLVATDNALGMRSERLRLTPGVYFGETGVLTGKATAIEVSALTHVTLYEISKEALAPLLKARPAMVDELSTVLAYRLLLRHTALDKEQSGDREAKGLVSRLADSIEQLFGLN